jgi:predicted CXXCH cytochrome family protein
MLTILLLPQPADAQDSPRRIPLHHFQLPCDYCHQPASSDNGKPKPGAGALWQCTLSGCHNFNAVLDHPVGKRPGGAVPDDMPLDSQSRITCVTCHYRKQAVADSNDPNAAPQPSLYSPEGIEFCAKCHAEMPGSILEKSHWQFSTRAHLGSINPQARPRQIAQHAFGGIDRESRMCLSCHENVGITVAELGGMTLQETTRCQTASDHPIGMNYRHIARHEQGRFNFPLTDHEIRLFDGNVGCGSCHSPYSPQKNNLVMSNLKSALCLKCHDM